MTQPHPSDRDAARLAWARAATGDERLELGGGELPRHGMKDPHSTAAHDPECVADQRHRALRVPVGVELGPEVASAKRQAESEGKTVVAVGWDGAARGILVVADTVKPTSAEAVAQLTRLGLRPVLLTGDNRAVAERAERDGVELQLELIERLGEASYSLRFLDETKAKA